MKVAIRNVPGMESGVDAGPVKAARLFDLGIEIQQRAVRVGETIQVFYWFENDEKAKASGLPGNCPYCVPA